MRHEEELVVDAFYERSKVEDGSQRMSFALLGQVDLVGSSSKLPLEEEVMRLSASSPFDRLRGVDGFDGIGQSRKLSQDGGVRMGKASAFFEEEGLRDLPFVIRGGLYFAVQYVGEVLVELLSKRFLPVFHIILP